MKIPESFKCAGFTIKVKIVDTITGNKFGDCCVVKNEIRIAKYLFDDDNEKIKLSEDQMFNTFAHELVHVWQFYYDNEFIESQAQVYANFICEFLKTRKDETN